MGWQRAAPLVLVVVAVAAIAALSNPPRPPLRTTQGPILPRAGFIHAGLAAQQQLVADYFWVLTTHQIGAAVTPEDFRDVYAYADLATDLDPFFRTVYWFAGVAIPVQTDRDHYVNADESTKLLRKGVSHFPDDFRIRYQLAQNLIYLHKQYRAAADELKALSSNPQAPSWLPSLATRLYAQSGEYEASVALTNQLIASAPDEDTKKFYQQRLKEIRQEGILKQIDNRAALFKKDKGRPPKTLNELQDAGYLAGLPPDPLNGYYFLDEKTGLAASSASKYRLGMITPEEHERLEHLGETTGANSGSLDGGSLDGGYLNGGSDAGIFFDGGHPLN